MLSDFLKIVLLFHLIILNKSQMRYKAEKFAYGTNSVDSSSSFWKILNSAVIIYKQKLRKFIVG